MIILLLIQIMKWSFYCLFSGGWGVDFSYDSENVEEGIQKVAKELLSHGVTSFCPTMVTSDKDKYSKILPKIHKRQGNKNGPPFLVSISKVHLFVWLEKVHIRQNSLKIQKWYGVYILL